MKTTIKAIASVATKGVVTKPVRAGKNVAMRKEPGTSGGLVVIARNESDYNKIMAEIEGLVEAGGGTIRKEDLTLYSTLAKAAHAYERHNYTIPPPSTLEGLLEWKMYELKLKQKGLAKRLHVSDAKLSLVMSGKQKPDVSLLKSIHEELGVDGNVLLSVI